MGRLARYLATHRTATLGVVVLLALVAVAVRRFDDDPPARTAVAADPADPAAGQPPLRLPLVNGSTDTLPTLGPDGSALRFGQTGASTCTDPSTGQEWRVRWKVADSAESADASSSPGRARLSATAFDVRTGTGDWVSQDTATWALRWTPTLGQALNPGPAEYFDRRGALPLLAAVPLRADQAPRYVTPDGACTVYPVPFGIGPAAAPGARTVGLIGDSLLAQLSFPDGDTAAGDNTAGDIPAGTGAIHTRLREVRVGVDAQAGRMWTPTPDAYPPLDLANGFMLDEIRGMRSADVLVIALGANDAGWVTMAPEGQRETRLAWMLLHLAPIIDELDASDRCTVLVTLADRETSYLNSTEADYADVAGRLNDYLRTRVAGSKGHLRLSDWAGVSAGHHRSDPEPWFGWDTLHLSAAGRAAYADQLAAAPARC